MTNFGRFCAYVLAGLPAAVGVGFVARYAYVTSDTPIDGATSAFLYGMIALAAYGGPAAVIAVWANGWRVAAVIMSAVVLATMVANITQTLGAIANRNAGVEAERSKAETQIKIGRTRLGQIEAELSKLAVVAVSAEAINAAQAAVRMAEGTKTAECRDGRGPKCTAAEGVEQAKRDALTNLAEKKGVSDERARLTREAAELRTKLDAAPAVKERDPLGKTLADVLSLPEDKASKLQYGVLSVIFELVVASVLALPELLKRRALPPPRSSHSARAAPLEIGPERATLNAEARGTISQAQQVGNVGRFILACMPRQDGERAAITAAYARYQSWCEDQQQPARALAPTEFAEQFRAVCARVGIQTERKSGKVYVLNVQLAA